MCLFENVQKKGTQKKKCKNTYPSSRDVQKAKKMWNTFTIFHQNEASLWRLARSISVYGWEKGGRKNFEMWIPIHTQNEQCKNTSPWSRGVKKAKKTWIWSRLFHQNEASQWRLVRSLPVYGWKKTCSQSSVPRNIFLMYFFILKNEYRYKYKTKSENFIWKLGEFRWATLALLVYLK